MEQQLATTRPKPFVFVLMPIRPEFDDIYKFGIKGAADDVGAYAERLDEQYFTGGMLERIFNQISKADVLVADMTGRNPNVFYEVGYSHALGKIVLLVTQTADDIPFDLKHHQHVVYAGHIDELKKQLVPKLKWAIEEAVARGSSAPLESLSVRIFDIDLSEGWSGAVEAVLDGVLEQREFPLPVAIRNNSRTEVVEITHAYLFARDGASLVPAVRGTREESVAGFFAFPMAYTPEKVVVPVTTRLAAIRAHPLDSPGDLESQYRLPIQPLRIPPNATETFDITFALSEEVARCDEVYRLRLHSGRAMHEYRVRLSLQLKEKTPPPSDPKQEPKL